MIFYKTSRLFIYILLMTLIPSFGYSFYENNRIHTINNTQHSPLLWSVELCNTKGVELTLVYGESPDLVDLSGNRLLQIALYGKRCKTENDKKKIIRLLLDFGADLNFTISKYEETPLMVATDQSDDIDVISWILQSGGHQTINDTDIYGNTALMLAVLMTHKQTICLLLSVGARTNVINDNGWSATQYANIHHQFSVANAIENYNSQGSPEANLMACRENLLSHSK